MVTNTEMLDRNGSIQGSVSCEEAKAILASERDARCQECGKEIADILQKYDCVMSTRQVLINGMPQGPADILIVTKD